MSTGRRKVGHILNVPACPKILEAVEFWAKYDKLVSAIDFQGREKPVSLARFMEQREGAVTDG